MKKRINFMLIIVAMISIVSCGTTKVLSGQGEGISEDKIIAEDKAKLHALAEMAEKSNADVSSTAVETVTETENGISKTFTKTASATSKESFQDIDVKKKTYRTSNGYDSKVTVKGKTKKEKSQYKD